jgi:hypothetical protein
MGVSALPRGIARGGGATLGDRQRGSGGRGKWGKWGAGEDAAALGIIVEAGDFFGVVGVFEVVIVFIIVFEVVIVVEVVIVEVFIFVELVVQVIVGVIVGVIFGVIFEVGGGDMVVEVGAGWNVDVAESGDGRGGGLAWGLVCVLVCRRVCGIVRGLAGGGGDVIVMGGGGVGGVSRSAWGRGGFGVAVAAGPRGAGGVGGAEDGGGSAASFDGIARGAEAMLKYGEGIIAEVAGAKCADVGDPRGDVGAGGEGDDVEVFDAGMLGGLDGIFAQGDEGVEEEAVALGEFGEGAWGV